MDLFPRILVIRFSSIGDIVLATSALTTIRSSFPNGHITFMTLHPFESLLEYHHHIDSIIPLRKTSSILYHIQVGKFIKKNEYDIVFDLHNSLRSRLIGIFLNQKVIRLRKPRWKRWLLFYFYSNKFLENFNSRLMYHQHLGKIWKEGDQIPNTSLIVTEMEKKLARKYIKKSGISKNYVVMIPGAAWIQKQWSSNKFAGLANSLKEMKKLDTVLIGSAKDYICFDIEKEVPEVLNLAGKTDLRQALAFLSNAKRVIGGDTGLVHAAEALNVPVSMILGPTSRETGGGVSLIESREIAVKNLWCRPCSQNGSRKCYRSKQICMELITEDQVYDTVSTG